jgi:transposase
LIPHGAEIFVGLDPIDLRWSFERLAGVVTERIGREARCVRHAPRLLRQEA